MCRKNSPFRAGYDSPTMPPIVMLNPSFQPLTTDQQIRALVPRWVKITITYQDQQGQRQTLIAEDFIARILQHEYDHLQGLVFLDRVEDNRDIICEQEFQKIISKNPNH